VAISLSMLLDAHNQKLDAEKRSVIGARVTDPLFVVAGPGTGKTACIALRVLKLVYVDRLDPTGIIATTFTKKAAAELRSRVLGWGFAIREQLLLRKDLTDQDREWLKSVDINQIFCGTIDSLCDQLLTQFRLPGEEVFSTIDDTINRTLLMRQQFLFKSENQSDPDLNNFLKSMVKSSDFGWNLQKRVDGIITISERIAADRIDLRSWRKSLPKADRNGFDIAIKIIDDHKKEISSRGYLDYSGMASEVLRRLQSGKLASFSSKVKAVLVDEYQDTNLLQESLYFELAKNSSGCLMVVGDDDQSLYRFRGATVELFSSFPARYYKTFRKKPTQFFLKTNYRSTKAIVNFVNSFVTIDKEFQTARVAAKPKLVGASKNQGAPILGMFRKNSLELAQDVSRFVDRIINGRGQPFGSGDFIKKPNGGSPGDVAVLASSPKEIRNGKPTFISHLRAELANVSRPIGLFNPRGQDISESEDILTLMGLAVQCLDPSGSVMTSLWKPPALGEALRLATDLRKVGSTRLRNFVEGWELRKGRWPESTPSLELLYRLAHLLPGNKMSDPEFLFRLEAVARQLSVVSEIGSQHGEIRFERSGGSPSKWETKSLQELLRDFVFAVLSGVAEVDESIMPSLPRDQVAVLSIHQSKGLEFPITIVDVGSAFNKRLPIQEFKRFPRSCGAPQHQEDCMRPHSSLGRPGRDPLDRTIDDLIRQYFVAFSRPESVLLLVGTSASSPSGFIENIATGYDRDGNRSVQFERSIEMI
jgi:DNA helicase II / ATP-dependent DNA helicase PcrA